MNLLQPIENAMTFFLVGYFFIRWFIVYFHEYLAIQTYYSLFECKAEKFYYLSRSKNYFSIIIPTRILDFSADLHSYSTETTQNSGLSLKILKRIKNERKNFRI